MKSGSRIDADGRSKAGVVAAHPCLCYAGAQPGYETKMALRNRTASWVAPLLGLLVVIACIPEQHFTGDVRAQDPKAKPKAKSPPPTESAPSQPVRTETIT